MPTVEDLQALLQQEEFGLSSLRVLMDPCSFHGDMLHELDTVLQWLKAQGAQVWWDRRGVTVPNPSKVRWEGVLGGLVQQKGSIVR